MNALGVLVMPIYNIALGMDPVKLGIALFIPHFVDAITDPLMGNISDNTRTRWGRRRPYIILGAVLSAVLLPLLWMPPFRTESGMFWYFLIVASIYSLTYTAFVVPYTALGYELTTDYDGRTRVLAWRMYIGLIGSLTVPWLYKLCLMPIFGGDAVVGARWVSLMLAAIIIVTGVLPAQTCREALQTQQQEKVTFVQAMLYTSRNRPFLILLVSYIIIICGLLTSGALGLYINIYYVCGGSKSFAATIGGMAGTLTALTHRLRICRPHRVGRTTSTVWIAAISSSTFRGSSPNPADLHIWPSVFHSTYARKQTSTWACTRSFFWCQIGRSDRSLL